MMRILQSKSVKIEMFTAIVLFNFGAIVYCILSKSKIQSSKTYGTTLNSEVAVNSPWSGKYPKNWYTFHPGTGPRYPGNDYYFTSDEIRENRQREMAKFERLNRDELFDTLFYRVSLEEEVRYSVLGSPLTPLSNFRSPCWVTEWSQRDNYSSRYFSSSRLTTELRSTMAGYIREGRPWHVRCLPGFFLPGVVKSGTSDLAINLFAHPRVTKCRKEYAYWNCARMILTYKKAPTFIDYLNKMDMAAEDMVETSLDVGNHKLYPNINIDGTPHYLWDFSGWENLPGNKGLLEPKYILADTLNRLIPGARYVIILREPVSRIFSQYRMRSRETGSADGFHSMVEKSLKLWRQCTSIHTTRACAYNSTLNPYEITKPGGIFIRASMYSIFLKDWMRVIPRQQFHIIRGEDYYADRSTVLQETYDFLGLARLSNEEMDRIQETKPKRGTDIGPMRNDTRELLLEFFQSFNRDLAEFLNNDDFLWGNFK